MPANNNTSTNSPSTLQLNTATTQTTSNGTKTYKAEISFGKVKDTDLTSLEKDESVKEAAEKHVEKSKAALDGEKGWKS